MRQSDDEPPREGCLMQNEEGTVTLATYLGEAAHSIT